jgi:GT2 family glycosyltransferase
MTTTSVVICCYTERRWDDIVEAVKSLADQTVAPTEVLVVVDHNPDLLARAEAAFDGVRILANTHRKGLSGARNTGVDAATGEIVAFLDDDAKADPQWLELLLAPYADPAVAAVGGAALPVWPDGRAPARLPAELNWVVGCAFTGQPVELAEVRNLMGCTMSFRRDALVRVGGFAEQLGRTATLPLGCEETELCIRLRQREPDAKVLLQPAATVRHRVTGDRLDWGYLRRRSWNEGVSKAAISRLVGQSDALSTERSYVSAVIPRALARSVRDGVRGKGFAGTGGLLLACSAAAGGYVAGRVRGVGRPEYTPTAVRQVDTADTPADEPALVLVRAGRETIGAAMVAAGERPVVEPQETPPPPIPDPLPSVSLVLATAGDPELAARCVHSVLSTGYPELEVVVVDNHRGDANPALLELAETDERIRYVREPVPGASRARNTGAAHATGDVLAFTDDDAVVDPGWLVELAAELADPGLDCVTGLVMPASLDTQAQAWFEAYGGFGKGFRRQEYGPQLPAPDPLYPLSPGVFGSGNNMAWRRESFLRVGGFDDRLGPGRRTKAGEDLDLFLRLILGGGRLTYTPHAVVWHTHRTTLPELRGQLRGYGTGLASMFLVHAMRPGGAAAIARRLPRGLRKLLAPSSDRNAERGADYPRQLVLDELRGMAAAPAAVLAETVRRR